MDKHGTILIVDDDEGHRSMLKTMLISWGYSIEEAEDGDIALKKIYKQSYDAVLTDVRMARMDGIKTLQKILEYNPALPVILMTAYSSVETAVEALRLGAYDYLIKPLDFDALKNSLSKALEHSRLNIENRELRRQLTESTHSILGHSKEITNMLSIIETIAPTEATVLITGESGTGKELIARHIHKMSLRATKPLITVNCAALSENLLESELFGHEKGAFTGADKLREGRFLQADGGTIFLDEIGEIPINLQAKLLRTLQQGELQRVGSDKIIQVDVRILAATNKDLREEVANKLFREDLFFRLNVINIEAPALRARADDIPLLAAYFMEKFSVRNRKQIRGFTNAALDVLVRYSWPGNVRELENAIERAVILSTGDLLNEYELPAHVLNSVVKPSSADQPSKDKDIVTKPLNNTYMPNSLTDLSLEEIEKIAIIETLKHSEDNKSEAARRLGITRATLHSKLKKYNIE